VIYIIGSVIGYYRLRRCKLLSFCLLYPKATVRICAGVMGKAIFVPYVPETSPPIFMKCET